MCGRYAIFTEEENQEIKEIINEINERFKSQESPSLPSLPREVFPTNTVPVLTRDSQGAKVVNLFKWGFPNFKQPGSVIINARSESLEERPTFRKLLFSNRCLIPASGFYEWKQDGGKKEKYLIRVAGEKLFYMAGLYNFTGFVVITTEASGQMSQIHNRMPAILTAEESRLWLDPASIGPDAAKKLLHPLENGALEFLKAI